MSGSGPYRESKPTGFDVESWFRKPGVQINPAGGHRFDLGMFDAQVDAICWERWAWGRAQRVRNPPPSRAHLLTVGLAAALALTVPTTPERTP